MLLPFHTTKMPNDLSREAGLCILQNIHAMRLFLADLIIDFPFSFIYDNILKGKLPSPAVCRCHKCSKFHRNPKSPLSE